MVARKQKNEAKKDLDLFLFLRDHKKYVNSWDVKKTTNGFVQEVLDKASKERTGNRGEPDLIYVNEAQHLLILIENKDSIEQHRSKEGNKPKEYAVDGIKHYLSFFTKNAFDEYTVPCRKYFARWCIVGIAVSGDVNEEYNHLISTYIVQGADIKDIETGELLDESDYVAFFENIDMEKMVREISEASRRINNLLRSQDSQKRPVLLSGLMICLFTKDGRKNDFKDGYVNWKTETIITNIPTTIKEILIQEEIPEDKIKILTNELAFIQTDPDIKNTSILKDILKDLEEHVIPLFQKETNYDILGKFYEEFLRFAGVTNVKKGIVLTPNHITKLFTELIDIKNNDIIFDPCCGTGAFLISAMNKLVSEINNSNIPEKKNLIKNIKENQLMGFEKSTTMYSLAISNMLFRRDGKSRVFNVDFFTQEADKIYTEQTTREDKPTTIRPTIGFMNPPYGGRDTKDNTTKKEIQFLEKLLGLCSRYVVVIAPLSAYFKEDTIRNNILKKHTLKCVINMPKDLFQPNASTHTAIAVFETNTPQKNKEVILYDLKDDGLVLSKNKGRTDALNKWASIKKNLLEELRNPSKYADGMHLVTTNIGFGDEWIIQAHAQTDYNSLSNKDFIDSVKEYTVLSTKLKLGLLDKNIDELTMLEILNENKVSASNVLDVGENE